MKKTSPSALDALIGQQLKRRRIKRKKTQPDLANILNLSFQQIQKYENGKNKIPSSSLYLLSKYLKTDIGYFFKDMRD
jgi:transcriptional regulator with XRE-family HTH domain